LDQSPFSRHEKKLSSPLNYPTKKEAQRWPVDAVDRFINTQKSRIRIRVEHAIGGVKRLAAVAQPYRNHTPKMEDQLMVVACGLWNFHLKCTL